MGGFTPAPFRKFVAPKRTPVAPRIQREAVAAAPAGPTRAEMRDGRKLGTRGRRATILTSSQGVDEDLTLGYKTLLGG